MAIKKRNPRYLVSLDGYDLATVPAFTKVEAVKRAKQIYPGRRGTWTAVQVEDEMFGRMRGGREYEEKLRMERRRTAAAKRATGVKTKRTRRNPDFDSISDVWAAISGLSPVASSRSAPFGNHPRGLILEEYELETGGYLQVAFDPALGGDPVEWEYRQNSPDSWLVG